MASPVKEVAVTNTIAIPPERRLRPAQGAVDRRAAGQGDRIHPQRPVGEFVVRLKSEPRSSSGPASPRTLTVRLYQELQWPSKQTSRPPPAPSPGRARPAPSAAQGKVPGVIYGHDRPPEPLAIDTAALNKMLVGHQRRDHGRGRRRGRPAAGQGADPRDPARSAPPGRDPAPGSLRGAGRREGHPLGAGAPGRHSRRRAELRRRARPVAPRARDRGASGRHPRARRARRHRADHRPLAVRARHQDPEGARSSTSPTRRCAPSWRRAPKRRRRSVEEVAARPSRSSSGSRRPRTRARARSRVEGLGSARHRGAGQPRPGVRGDPAQRRVSPGRPSGGSLGLGAFRRGDRARVDRRAPGTVLPVSILKPRRI